MSFSRTLGDGRINLEQQRKRAKELLRQWRRDPASRTGLPGQEPRLADAQWQVARELGFASWPRLKAHVDAIAFASRPPTWSAAMRPRPCTCAAATTSPTA